MKYEREEALAKASQVFWQKGFQAATMRDLQQAMDMRPGSIYAAFGDKNGLFKAVLERYVVNSLQSIQRLAELNMTSVDTLKQFLLNSLHPCSKRGSRNCLLVKTVTELEAKEPALSAYAQAGLIKVREAIAGIVQQGQTNQEISPQLDSELIASQLQMQLIGLRIYAQIVEDEQLIGDLVNETLRPLVFKQEQSQTIRAY